MIPSWERGGMADALDLESSSVRSESSSLSVPTRVVFNYVLDSFQKLK